MAGPIVSGAVHHVALTVTDVDRSVAFYTDVLGFQVFGQLGPKTLLSNGSVLLGLAPAPDARRAITDDRFDENRVGLDHLSFTVASRDELERAAQLLDERGSPHGDFDVGPRGTHLAFRDPDNIQLEVTAPHQPGAS